MRHPVRGDKIMAYEIKYVYSHNEHIARIYDGVDPVAVMVIAGPESMGWTQEAVMERAQEWINDKVNPRDFGLEDFVAEGNLRDADGDIGGRRSSTPQQPFVNEVIEVVEDNGGAELETRRGVVAREIEPAEMLNALRVAKQCAGDAYTSKAQAEERHFASAMLSGVELKAEKALLATGRTLFAQGYRYGSIRQQDGAVIMPARTILAQQESLYHNAGGIVMLHIEYVFKK
jgi:hypothetical protein